MKRLVVVIAVLASLFMMGAVAMYGQDDGYLQGSHQDYLVACDESANGKPFYSKGFDYNGTDQVFYTKDTYGNGCNGDRKPVSMEAHSACRNIAGADDCRDYNRH